MTEEKQSVQTKNLTVNVHRSPGCKLNLEISVSPAATLKAYTNAMKAINKEVSIPGFRTGKAPQALIKQRFEKQINQEWRSNVLNDALKEFIETTNLHPFQSNSRAITKAEVKSISNEKGSQLILEYEVKPEIPDVKYEELQLTPQIKNSVTEADIDETIHQIQLHYSNSEPVTDRPVMEGDIVQLDIEALENPPRSICQDTRFEVAAKRMGTWMRELIIGKSVNETVEGMSEKEDSPYSTTENFTPTLCRITIKAISKVELPQLDNELAEKVGLKSIDELRVKVREDLERNAEEEYRNSLRAQVESLLLEKYTFDIPFSLIEKQSQDTLQERIQKLKTHEHSSERLEEMKKELKVSITQELTHAYNLYFLTHKIAEKANINVYESEIYREGFKQYAQGGNRELLLSNMEKDEFKSKLYVNILTRKVLDFIVDKISMS